MAKFCSQCGAPLSEDSAVCPSCGHAPEAEAPPAANQTAPSDVEPRQAASYNARQNGAPAQVSAAEAAATAPVGTWEFFGLLLLYSLPVVGFVSALIMTFACKNKSMKHFALAALIWQLIGLVLTAVAGFAVYLLGGTILEAVRGIVAEALELPADAEWSEIVDEIMSRIGKEAADELAKDIWENLTVDITLPSGG